MPSRFTWPLIRRRLCAAALATLMFGAGRLLADQPGAAGDAASESPALSNWVGKTAGGKQFWGDVSFFHNWRIQRNVVTDHYRLLDGQNNRHAWGTLEACRSELDAIRRRDQLPPMEGKAVILLHGLFRTRSTMLPMARALEEGGEYTTFVMSYPTTRGSVADHAASLDSVVRSLDGITEINFVAHSLGNLVVRHWLHDLEVRGSTLPPGQRFGRMVMLAPPNQHPQIAAQLLSTQFAAVVAGPAAEQLATGWTALEPQLATPPFDFGILAGGTGSDRGYNPLLPGDDDAVVTVEGTRLPGAADFRRLPVLHSFVMHDRSVQRYTLRFLRDGCFESAATRQPVAAPDGVGPTSESPSNAAAGPALIAPPPLNR